MGRFPVVGDLRELFYLSTGSVMIALCSGIGLISAFEGSLIATYVCLIGFLIGYRVVQLGVHSEEGLVNYVRSSSFLGQLTPLDYISLVGGSVIIASSFSLLTEGIVLLDVFKSFSAAILMGAGYMVSHWALNNTLV